MSKIYPEILDPARREVFQKLAAFRQIGVLGGGTAIALQLKHRYSYDFDLFSTGSLPRNLLQKVITVFGQKIKKIVDNLGELTFITPQEVKVSFIHFPFPPRHPPLVTDSISLFDLRDLASNKAYVIGRRGEYRDYVDLFFLFKNGLKLETIIAEAEERFGGGFSHRLFLEQLVYFEDLEIGKIDFIDQAYSPKEIKVFFQKMIGDYLGKSKV